MVKESQNWAKLVQVGDIQVLLCKRSVPCDDPQVPDEFKKTGRIVYLLDVDFHLNEDEKGYTLWYNDKDERNQAFDLLGRDEMEKLIKTELGCDI